jgi:hypothetical protein
MSTAATGMHYSLVDSMQTILTLILTLTWTLNATATGARHYTRQPPTITTKLSDCFSKPVLP